MYFFCPKLISQLLLFFFFIQIVKQKKRPQRNIKKNEKLENLYVRCWDHEPDRRPTMKEIVQYLENIRPS